MESCGERARQQRERDRETERKLLQIGHGVCNKFGHWRKYLRWM
jgi:hypothetical protein